LPWRRHREHREEFPVLIVVRTQEPFLMSAFP
jgi:hypothetical protein